MSGRTDSPSAARRWSIRILPFAPIVLALAVGLGGRSWFSSKVEPIAAGAPAPDFSLRDAQKDERADPVTLSRLVQKGPVVIIFHIGLQCPICAQNLLTYAARMDDFKKAGIQVVAISPQDPAETRATAENWGGFPFPLLWDPDNKTARAYGLEIPDYGFLDGAFLVDKDRRIQLAERSNEPFGDISRLLETGTGSKSPR
jgi:peroxiredoxin